MSITIIMLKSSFLNNLDVIKMDRFSLFASKWKYYIFVFIFCLRKYRTLVCSSTISTYIFVNMILNITATPLIYKENISVMTSFLRCGNNISPFFNERTNKGKYVSNNDNTFSFPCFKIPPKMKCFNIRRQKYWWQIFFSFYSYKNCNIADSPVASDARFEIVT